jgi:fatty acid/phospholipid biosynthesis enzyme
MHNEWLSQAMHDEVPRGLFRTNCEDPFMSAAIDEMNNTTSTIKHRAPIVMGVPLPIVSSHQGTQKKKRYSRLKSKAETAKRRE